MIICLLKEGESVIEALEVLRVGPEVKAVSELLEDKDLSDGVGALLPRSQHLSDQI